MQLNEIHIMNIGMLAQNFSMEELWDNALNGTLAQFEQEVRNTDRDLQDEICRALTAFQKNEQPDFVSGNRLLPGRLRERLERFQTKSQDVTDGTDFFSRDWKNVETVSASLQTACSAKQAWKLYLLLLLHFQAHAKKALRQEDIDYLTKSFSAKCGEPENRAEEALARRAGRRIFLVDRNLLYARGNVIYRWTKKGRGGWKEFFRGRLPFCGIAYSESYGLIACMEDGSMPEETHPEVKRLADGREIVDVSAYGSCVLLLTGEGELLAMPDFPGGEAAQIKQWRPVLGMQAGLNSLSCIVGEMREARQLGSDAVISDFTDVKKMETRTDEEGKHYIILRNDGTIYTDNQNDDKTVKGAQNCCLGRSAYIYAVREGEESKLFMQSYNTGTAEKLCDFPPAFQIRELCAREEGIACLGVSGGRELLLFQEDLSAGMDILPFIYE